VKAKATQHKWEFKARFRRHAFGWKSQPAVTRVKEALAELKKVAKTEPEVAAEGAVQLLERLSPALEQVDSSSGAIGSAVNRAIEELAPLIGGAKVDAKTRGEWLHRLWDAYEADGIPYLESIGDVWGELCGSTALASQWADKLIGEVRRIWTSKDRTSRFYKGATNCLSALAFSGRTDDLMALLAVEERPFWPYQRFGVQALLAQGKKAEAIRLAESCLSSGGLEVMHVCEEILLSSGLVDEAYRRYGLKVNQGGTYLATFRAVAKRYPTKKSGEILADLAKTSPGNEGKWFAAAKEAGLYSEAIALVRSSPCDPRTLTRAALDFADTETTFAADAGLLAIHWLLEGHGYEVKSWDVQDSYRAAMAAAARRGTADATKEHIRQMVAAKKHTGTVAKTLEQELGR
jgi:hypothetical protein